MVVFSIDGVTFSVNVMSLKRKAAVLDGDKAQRTQDARMHRDLKGTFYNYSINIDASLTDITKYDELYERLTAPVPSHTITFPYGQDILTFEAYVTNADDELLHMGEHKKIWGNLAVNFISMGPQRLPG